MQSQLQPRKLSTVSAILGESPFWSPREAAVWWVDITAGRILRTDTGTGETLGWETGEQTGFVVPGADGRLIAGLTSGLYLFDPSLGSFTLLKDNPVPRSRFNDGVTDPAGRIIAGVMDLDNATPIGAIFSIGPDLDLRLMFDGLYTPNGLAFDPARGRMYFSDSHPEAQTIWVCDYNPDTSETANRRVFATCTDIPGRPDGACVDREGNYWMAGVGGGACLWKFAPDGSRETLAIPQQEPTKPIFDADGTLYYTSKEGTAGGGFLQKAADVAKGAPPVPFRLEPSS